MKKIFAELSRIQQELKAPKNLYNSYGNYKYRNAEGILEAVKPLLNGLVLIINDEPVVVGERYYIKAVATLTDGDESIACTAYAREDETKKGMDGCQLTGSCSSYARKYALNALLMIDDSKDSDDDSLSPKNPANQEKPKKEVKKDSEAEVAVQKTLPEQKKDDPKEVPVQVFLLGAMKALREERGISADQNNKLFKKQRDALIERKLAPDKPLTEYTLQEAESLIDAMYKCFTTTGTEFIKK